MKVSWGGGQDEGKRSGEQNEGRDLRHGLMGEKKRLEKSFVTSGNEGEERKEGTIIQGKEGLRTSLR